MAYSGKEGTAPDRVTQLYSGNSTLAERIAALRSRLFVGRDDELAAYKAFVAPDSPHAIWFITGAGGVGKTTLLQRIREEAAAMSLDSVFVDARHVPPNPPAVREALARASGSETFAEFCRTRRRPLLLIDTFEYWQALEPWLRQEFLPSLPDTLQLVACSRTEPGLEWRSDEGWRPLLRLTRLAALDERACGEYLLRRGLDRSAHRQLIRFSGGYPLALAMGADSLLSGHTVDASGLRSDDSLIQGLVENFTREARDAGQRRAMDACAVVREINESQLAAMIGGEKAGELYEWLRGLAFVETGETGIFPHDLVREVLMREMPQRYPGRYEAFALAAFDWIVDRIEAAGSLSWPQAAQLAADGMYALRALPVVQHFLQPTGTRALYLDRVRADDDAALADMVLRHEGPQSLHWFEFWRERHPQAIFVVRDASETPRGFFLKLDMEALDPEARAADPLTRRLWEALENRIGLAPEAHAPFIRFWETAEHGQSQSPEKTQILMAVNTYNLMARNLRITAQVFGDSQDWVQQARALGIDLLAASDTRIGDTVWRIYYNDWQRESPTRYYRRFARRCIEFAGAVAGKAAPPQAYKALTEQAFREAMVTALKHLHRPAELSKSPLLASALVVHNAGRGADEQSRMRVLTEQINATVEELGRAGAAGLRWQRVLHRAYLAPAQGQKQAAAALNMGYSTFRRQLAEARQVLADELWLREKAAR